MAKILIAAWGSILVEPRNLLLRDEWHEAPFPLDIEYTRKSMDGRLTLVVDMRWDNKVHPYINTLDTDNLDDAIYMLWCRETAKNSRLKRDFVVAGFDTVGESIWHGMYSDPAIENRYNRMASAYGASIGSYLHAQKADYLIFTGLPPNLESGHSRESMIVAALEHLVDLDDPSLDRAFDYIQHTPDTVRPYLRAILSDIPRDTVAGREVVRGHLKRYKRLLTARALEEKEKLDIARKERIDSFWEHKYESNKLYGPYSAHDHAWKRHGK